MAYENEDQAEYIRQILIKKYTKKQKDSSKCTKIKKKKTLTIFVGLQACLSWVKKLYLIL